jgi:hypothetical protein
MYDYRKEIPLDDVVYEAALPEEAAAEGVGSGTEAEHGEFEYEWRFPV